MAKINEEILVIKISTLVADRGESMPVMGEQNFQALRLVIEQMAGEQPTLVEIERA